MHHLQDINGNTYQYDPNSGAILYGQADADAFAYDDGKMTYFLSACGCAAETGCQCRQEMKPMTTAAASPGSRRTVYRTMYTPPDTPTKTPLSWIRASVERVRSEMRAEKAERKAERTRQRVANETAVAYRAVSSRPVPDGYAEGLKKLGLPEPLPVVRDDDGVPLPYSTALRQR